MIISTLEGAVEELVLNAFCTVFSSVSNLLHLLGPSVPLVSPSAKERSYHFLQKSVDCALISSSKSYVNTKQAKRSQVLPRE